MSYQDRGYIHAENLIIALATAIKEQERHEFKSGYTQDSSLLAGWKASLAALKMGNLEIRYQNQ